MDVKITVYENIRKNAKQISKNEVIRRGWSGLNGSVLQKYWSSIKNEYRISNRDDGISSIWSLIHSHPEKYKGDGWIYFRRNGISYKVKDS